ncbi:M23 family metallopeptidase, partial [bacterium]|nr:M23 family metallopeptidase [bacterium]
MKKSLRIGLYLIFLCFYSSIVYSYPWPLKPTNQQGYVFSTLDECRENRDHFHDGIDIDCDTGDTVYAVAGGQVIYFTGGDGLYVDRYGYAHTIPFVPNYSNVDAGDSIATVNYRSHLHFMDGPNNSEINPLRPGGISPFSDWADPTIGFPIRFFEDDMGAELDPYDLEGKVDIVIKAWDSITYGGSNAGIYEIGYEIWDGWIRVYGPIFNLTFDNWLESTYIETVYAPGSDTYNFYYIVTNNMTSNNYWDVEATTEADKDYICRILAYDIDQGDQYEDFSIHTAGTGIEDEVSVTVTSPNGGEEWEVGSEHNITWCASAYILGMHLPVEYVLIDYSKDGGWVYP